MRLKMRGAAATVLAMASFVYGPLLQASEQSVAHVGSEGPAAAPDYSLMGPGLSIPEGISPNGIASESLPAVELSLSNENLQEADRTPSPPISKRPVSLRSKKRNDWNNIDIALDSAFLVLLLGDWMQTRTLARNGWVIKTGPCDPNQPEKGENHVRYEEQNMILGRRPSLLRLDTYILLVGVAHTIIAHQLPEAWRRRFLLGSVALEVYAVNNNFQLGVRFY